MFVAVALVLICLVVLGVWSTWFKQQPDAPRLMEGSLPIIGHSHIIFGDRKHLWKFVRYINEVTLEPNYDGVLEMWFGPMRYYVITDPEDSLTLVNACYSKPYIYGFAQEFLKNGLITADVSIWKNHRKLLNPAFNQQVLNTFVDEMNVQSRNLVLHLKNEVDKKPFDIRQYFITFTLSTVSRTSLGLTAQEQKQIDRDYAVAIEDLLALYCDRFQKVWLHIGCIFKWSALKRKQDKLMTTLRNIMNPIILKRKSEMKANTEPMYDSAGKFKPVLDRMLQIAHEQSVFTDDDIREHLDTLIAAAYDTTSSAMSFILLVIGTYPEVQNRIYNEIQEVLQNKNDDFSKHDLQKLVYLEAVMKETMRLWPAVPIIARQIDVDVKLKNCTLRSNSTGIIGVHGLHRHPLWGPDANEFKPERWLDPSTLPDNPTVFAAFGVGKRNCIGKLLGMLMMKTAIAHIVRQYHISGDIHKIDCQFDVVLKPVTNHHIGLKLRS